MKTVFNISVIAMLLAVARNQCIAEWRGASGPPPASVGSPDGKWDLVCKAPTQGAEDFRCALWLKPKQGVAGKIRRVDYWDWFALWSPDSLRIAISDRWASDRSDVLIYSVSSARSEKSLARLFPKHVIPSEELNGHCYFEAVKWLDSRRLEIRVSGHRDEFPANSFDYRFIFDVRSGVFENITKKGRTLKGVLLRSAPSEA